MANRREPSVSVRLHQLEGFHHVARHEGFTRAADAMPYPITQPALHQQVRKLERALGVELLARGPGRRMLLTPEGRALREFVAPFFDQLPGLLRSIAASEAGTLVVGTEPLYAEGLCATALASLKRRLPDLRVRLLELEVPAIVAQLGAGDVDVGVASLASVPEGVAVDELGRLGLRLLVPADHPLARRRGPLDSRHFAGHRFVLYAAGTQGRAYTDRALAQAKLAIETAAEASSVGSLRAFVRAGLAPAFVPALGVAQRVARRTLTDGTVEIDLTHLLERVTTLPRFGLLRRSGTAPAGLVAAFRDAAHAALA
ncbi:MAG: LysR family transcriptional regulator [Planctomycetes bacterium]|nr:LysR family transcriptional regulator [Planctomycetota bacterium]